MDRQKHIQERRAEWKKFELLVRRAEGTRRPRLTPRDISTYSRMFRELCYDLATVRSRGWGKRLENYLNDLVARGHNAFYRDRQSRWAAFGEYLTSGFPRLFRQYIGYFWVASALFYLPLLITGYVVFQDPAAGTRVVDADTLEQAASMYDFDPDDPDNPGITEMRAVMHGFYVWNNTGIALRSFAGGFLMGLVTVYTLLSNGIGIGATLGYICSAGHAKALTSFVITHGAFELTAIGVAGGAGLILGNALIHPGNMTRLKALQTRGKDAGLIALGAALMMLIAAIIEAWWSPAAIHSAFKYSVGTLMWIVVTLYFVIAGRGDDN